MAVLMLALTGCASTDDSDDGAFDSKSGASPSTAAPAEPAQSPTSAAPEDWTEPERWAVLPRGERTDRYGNETGFPHTTEGAVAMLKATCTTEVDRERSLVDQRLSIYSTHVAKADRSDDNAEKIELSAMKADKKLHRDMGVDPSRPMPYGTYVRSYVVGFQLIKESEDEVSAWMLARVTMKAEESGKESAGYTRSLVAALWEDGDWKLSGAATERALQQIEGKTRPEGGAPGDAEFNVAGWTAIREAS